MLESLTSLILLCTSLFSAIWLLHRHKQATEAHHYRVRVFALSCLFISSYALCQLLLRDPGSHTGTLLQMTENLSIYVALPFIATVFVALAKGWHWSMAGWGRWLLGLIAFFELTRRTDYGISYSYTLSILVLLALLFSLLLIKPVTARLLLAAGTLLLASGTLLFSPLPLLMPQGHSAGFMLLLAFSLPLLSASLDQQLQPVPVPNQ